MTKSIEVEPKALEHCAVKAKLAADLTIEEAGALAHWAEAQSSYLWDGMSLQEVLNVYRVSAEWITWEGWAEEDREAAHAAWNRAVIAPGNRMRKQAA